MVFHKRWKRVEPVGIVQHADVVVDSVSDPWVCGVRCLFLAEVGDDHWEPVVLGEMPECGIVVDVSNVEDEEYSGFPLLHGQHLNFGLEVDVSGDVILPEQTDGQWNEVLG